MRRRFPIFALSALLLAGLGSAGRAAETTSPVEEIHDVRYYQGPDADPERHCLDLYLPKDKKNFPLAVFVHGGGWMFGDRTFFGRGPELGKHFASLGIGVIMPGYRLSPQVKHPGHVQDVARAIAWVVEHPEQHRGDLHRLYLVGHSAGGHLVSLLATDQSYLKKLGIPPSVIKGVISVSGVYRLPEVSLRFGVAGATALQLHLNPFAVVFGSQPRVLQQAFPLAHVKTGLPPFLLINADKDLPGLAAMAREFAQALKEKGVPAKQLTVPDRNHDSVLFEASNPLDPVSRAISTFILRGNLSDSSH
jgi:acetyl esterase/lipase